jgi:hypothetical protein
MHYNMLLKGDNLDEMKALALTAQAAQSPNNS